MCSCSFLAKLLASSPRNAAGGSLVALTRSGAQRPRSPASETAAVLPPGLAGSAAPSAPCAASRNVGAPLGARALAFLQTVVGGQWACCASFNRARRRVAIGRQRLPARPPARLRSGAHGCSAHHSLARQCLLVFAALGFGLGPHSLPCSGAVPPGPGALFLNVRHGLCHLCRSRLPHIDAPPGSWAPVLAPLGRCQSRGASRVTSLAGWALPRASKTSHGTIERPYTTRSGSIHGQPQGLGRDFMGLPR